MGFAQVFAATLAWSPETAQLPGQALRETADLPPSLAALSPFPADKTSGFNTVDPLMEDLVPRGRSSVSPGAWP